LAFSDWSTTAASNGTVLGVNIAEGCSPANVNNAIRQAMADIRAAIDPTLAAFLASTSLDQARTALGVPSSSPTGLVPAGAIFQFAASAPPTGYLECDGSAVSRSTYSGLFAVTSTVFGVGDGSTTFNLPDLRGEFVRGWDHGRGIDSGRAFGDAQADELEAHVHTLDISALTQISHDSSVEGDRTVDASGSATSGYVGSTGGTETRPRNISLLFCIKT
jgi:microcystin-dependent protein